MLSSHLGRFGLVLALACIIAAGMDFSEAQGQNQQQQNKNKNKNKNKNLPPVTPAALPPNTLANGKPAPMPMPGQPPVKTVEKEIEWMVSEDATVQKLQKSATGLNYVDAKTNDLADGQKITVTVTSKGDKDSKKVDHYSGTLVRFSDNKLTMRCTFTDKEDTPDSAGREVAQISIRNATEK